MGELVLSLHIHRFIDLIKSSESRGLRDLTMSVRDAKDLHADITKLLLTLEGLRESTARADEPVQVEIVGGTFRNS